MIKKQRATRCVIPRIAKNPKAFYRWMKMYILRVKQTEREIGSEIRPC